MKASLRVSSFDGTVPGAELELLPNLDQLLMLCYDASKLLQTGILKLSESFANDDVRVYGHRAFGGCTLDSSSNTSSGFIRALDLILQKLLLAPSAEAPDDTCTAQSCA